MKQLLLTLLCLFAVTVSASADERSWSFLGVEQTIPDCTNGATTNLANSSNSSNGSWDFTCTTKSKQKNKTDGPCYGSKDNPVSKGATLALKNSDIPANATITEVAFTLKGNAKASGSKWFLKIGNQGGQNNAQSFSGNSVATKTWSNLNMTGNEVVIELAENSTGGGFHLQGVKITYTTTTGPTQCEVPTFSVNGSALSDGDNVYPDDVIKAACTTPGSTVKLFVHETTIGDEYSVSESDLNSSLTLKATASVVGNENYTDSEATITVNVVEKPEPVCAEPTFNVENGASVYPGQEISAACETDGSTLTLTLNGNPLSGTTYTVSDSDVNKQLNFTATASIQGNKGPITSTKSITVNVVPKPAARVFVPATKLEAGKNYILASKLNNKIYVMGSTPGSNNIPAASTTFTDASKIEFPFKEDGNYDYLIMVLGEETVDGETQYYLSDGGKPTEIKYLNPGEGTSSNVLRFTHQTSTKVARFKGSISNNVTSIVFTCKTERNKLFVNPNNNKPIFSSYSSKGSGYGDVMLYVEEVTTPEPTAVTVAFTGNAAEYTVGQEGVSVGYAVTPAEAAQYVNFTSSNAEAVTVAKNAENNALNLTFNQAAENVTVTASLAEGHESEYTLSPASFSFNVVAGQVEIKEPGQVKSDPVSEGGIFELNRGDRITFYSENAAKLKFELTYEAPEGETPYKLSFVENAPYIYTVTENIEEIIVTPLDAEETAYDDKAFTGMIYVISNPISETTVTFDYTKSSLIDESYSQTNGYIYTKSGGVGLFETLMSLETNESTDGKFTYTDKGWELSTEEIAQFDIQIYTNSDFQDLYSIKKIVFHIDTESTIGNVNISDSEGNNLDGYTWTGNSPITQFSLLTLDKFILTGIDVTYAHDEIESPYIFEKDGKVAISHSKTDHKIFYRVVNKKANAANRAPSAGETYNEYTTPLTVKSGDIVYAYAQHPHGMMSDNAVFDVDTYILTEVDGIEDAVEEDVEWFTLDGVRVAEPVKGMYIRVSNGKAQKIML